MIDEKERVTGNALKQAGFKQFKPRGYPPLLSSVPYAHGLVTTADAQCKRPPPPHKNDYRRDCNIMWGKGTGCMWDGPRKEARPGETSQKFRKDWG